MRFRDAFKVATSACALPWLVVALGYLSTASGRTLTDLEMQSAARGAATRPNCTHRVFSQFCNESLCTLHTIEADCKAEDPLICCNGTDRTYSKEDCKTDKPWTARDCTTQTNKGKCGKIMLEVKCVWDATKDPKCFCSGKATDVDCDATKATYSNACNPVVK